MTILSFPTEHRIALYDHVRNRRLHYQQEAYELLGGQCALCGCAENLRLRFLQPGNPLAKKYQHSPGTLFRRIFREPEVRKQLNLLCRACRLARYGPTATIQSKSNASKEVQC